MEIERKHRIKNKTTGKIYRGTIPKLVDFVNNHPDYKAKDYEFLKGCISFGFELKLKELGYSFDNFERAVLIQNELESNKQDEVRTIDIITKS